MVKTAFFPLCLVMTGLAFFPVAAMMRIVFPMAGYTGRGRFTVLDRILVTGFAAGLVMPAFETKIRVLVMIEFGFSPFTLVMTISALRSIAPVMHIIQRMTALTGFYRVLVFLVDVAGIAGRRLVCAVQRKVGFIVVVIEFFPAFHRVTAVAFVAQVSLVGVLLAVTAVAGRRGLGILFSCFVACAAGHRGMRTLQAEIGTLMVKYQGIQSDYVGVTTKVFAVTGLTGGGCNIVKAAMVTGLCTDILLNIFMTAKTQLRLRRLAEP